MYVAFVTVTGRSEIFDTDAAYGAAGSELTSSYVMRCFRSEISSTCRIEPSETWIGEAAACFWRAAALRV
jgi:hypothetical protein